MDSHVAQFPKIGDRKFGYQQIFFLVIAIGWLFFIQSSLEYKSTRWFSILISGRSLLFFGALGLLIMTWRSEKRFQHIESIFLFICLSFQALCGVLEGENSTDFANFVAVFVLMIPIFHKASPKAWALRIYPLICAIAVLPIFFKSSAFFSSIGAFADQFSAIVSSLLVSFLIGRTTGSKNEAQETAKRLQKELTQERDQQKIIIETQTKQLAEARVNAHIAQATQMVAHDVRRPFSLLRAGIELIRSSASPEEITRTTQAVLSDVEESLEKADSLIGDIIAISRRQPINLAPLKLEDTLAEAVYEFRKHNRQTDIEFQFSIRHSKIILGDQAKLLRVLSNIFTNALQAMNGKGCISLSTTDVPLKEEPAIRLSIHNTGPLILEEDAKLIFDSFFTKGKQGGTGLGLAIAKNFVEAHRGEIECEFSAAQGVCFHIRIPATEETYEARPSERLKKMAMPTHKNGEHQSEKTNSIFFPLPKTNLFFAKPKSSSDTFNVLIVEDEAIFQKSLLSNLQQQALSHYDMQIFVATNASEAESIFDETQPKLVFLDIDLGPNSPDGLEILMAMRAKLNKPFICIYSNRLFLASEKTPQELGADAFVPKPISPQKTFDIVEEAKRKSKPSSHLPRVAILDDEEIYLQAWKNALHDAEAIIFEDPETFYDEVIENEDVLSSLSCIIFDFYFNGTDMDKLKLVRTLRSRGFNKPIILSTNAPYQNNSGSQIDSYDAIIKKHAMSFGKLQTLPGVNSGFEIHSQPSKEHKK